MRSRYRIREATAADVAEVAAIERQAFTDPWTPSAFRRLLGEGFLVCEDGSGVVGYVVTSVAADEAEILNVAVRPGNRRRGVGRRLLGASLDRSRDMGARAVYLEVRESAGGAQRFYRSLGFAPVGRRQGYYSKPTENAVVMGCRIDATPSPQ